MVTQSLLSTLQQRYGPDLERTLRSFLETSGPTNSFYTMMQYQLGYADERLQPTSGLGGKRFRPLLCLFACETAGGNWADALSVAAAIELLHNFSLIHDDIEDRDPMRHHRPTVWKVWGEPQAINVGDGMFALSYHALLTANLDDGVSLDLFRHFDRTTRQLTEGQYLDMSFEDRAHIDVDEYLLMIGYKTAGPAGFSMYAGGCVAGARVDTCEALAEFGTEFGLAFQIRDDIMGVWGDPRRTGKEAHSDLRNRKKTLPILVARRCAGHADAQTLDRFLSRESDDIDGVLAILAGTDARDATEQEAQRHLQLARRALARAHLDAEAGNQFMSLAYELGT